MSVQEPTKPFCNNLHFHSATFYKKGLQKTLIVDDLVLAGCADGTADRLLLAGY
jgi:hypothetical protein